MATTLSEVARAAGVSTATVSRILNGKASNIPISETTHQRVYAAAQNLGYRPDPAASRLASKGGFHQIGAIFPKYVLHLMNHPFYLTVLRGIADVCQGAGYDTLLIFADLDCDEMTYRTIVRKPANGFILTTVREGDSFVARFQRDRLPFVHIGRCTDPGLGETAYVDMDNYAGARLAVEHLVGMGHRRIATITGLITMAAAQDRLRAYQDVLRDAGISGEQRWIAAGDFDEASGYRAMLALLAVEPTPTAVFAASDDMAIGALRAMTEMGVRVPDEMALVGFDDIPDASRTSPPLTTVHQPIFELGQAAARLLLHRLTGTGAPPATILAPQLIERESAGPLQSG